MSILKRDYFDAYSIMSLNHRQRKNNYYKINCIKIISRFLTNYVIPRYIWNKREGFVKVKVCWNSDERYLGQSEKPEFEFIFDFKTFNNINVFIRSPKHKTKEYNVTSFMSIVNILKNKLKNIVKRYNEKNIIDYDLNLDRLSDMVIENDFGERIDYVELYNQNEEQLIRVIFIAIDSYYLGCHTEEHPFNYY